MHPDWFELQVRDLVDKVVAERVYRPVWVELDELDRVLRSKRGCRR